MSLKKIFDKLKQYGLSDKQANEVVDMVRMFAMSYAKKFLIW